MFRTLWKKAFAFFFFSMTSLNLADSYLQLRKSTVKRIRRVYFAFFAPWNYNAPARYFLSIYILTTAVIVGTMTTAYTTMLLSRYRSEGGVTVIFFRAFAVENVYLTEKQKSYGR